MRILLLIIAVLAPPVSSAATPDPDKWYRAGYAPLWADKPGDNIGRILGYYADEVETRSADGSITRTEKGKWLKAPMEGWLAEGWLRATLIRLETDRINDTTASFKAAWRDEYKDSPDEISCGWYLADVVDGRWRFTVYADLDCEAHGLATE